MVLPGRAFDAVGGSGRRRLLQSTVVCVGIAMPVLWIALSRLVPPSDGTLQYLVPVPPGGGHWGGGMFINAYDMARFGYLFLRNGKWKDRQIVSEKWIQMARTPGSDNATYGYANWYLNTGRKPLPAAPETAVRFVGNGSNIIYIDWDNDIVAVVRWIRSDQALNDVVAKLIKSLNAPSTAAH